MVTKGLITAINRESNRCTVRLPLFETASSTVPVEIEALISITPGLFNNLFENDVVFVAFEENALEKPIIIGKLYTGAVIENETPGGAGILDTLLVRKSGSMPAATTTFVFQGDNKNEYENLKTPKKIADYIKALEKYIKNLFKQLASDFVCFKNWAQWQLRPENVEIDDGDLDTGYNITEAFEYQAENSECKICGKACSKKDNKRSYQQAVIKDYPFE